MIKRLISEAGMAARKAAARIAWYFDPTRSLTIVEIYNRQMDCALAEGDHEEAARWLMRLRRVELIDGVCITGYRFPGRCSG
jgi:hypothetical protein